MTLMTIQELADHAGERAMFNAMERAHKAEQRARDAKGRFVAVNNATREKQIDRAVRTAVETARRADGFRYALRSIAFHRVVPPRLVTMIRQAWREQHA